MRAEGGDSPGVSHSHAHHILERSSRVDRVALSLTPSLAPHYLLRTHIPVPAWPRALSSGWWMRSWEMRSGMAWPSSGRSRQHLPFLYLKKLLPSDVKCIGIGGIFTGFKSQKVQKWVPRKSPTPSPRDLLPLLEIVIVTNDTCTPRNLLCLFVE